MPTEAGQSLLNTFDRVRIINLKHRSDRRREIESELTRFGLAVDGKRYWATSAPPEPISRNPVCLTGFRY